MSQFWGDYTGRTKFISILWRWAENADMSIYLKNEGFIKLRHSLIPYYFSEDHWNIAQRQRIHVLIENRMAGKDNGASWETHAGLRWSAYAFDDKSYQGLDELHESLEFTEGSKYLPLYGLAWDENVDNRYAHDNLVQILEPREKRKDFWKKLHRCLQARSEGYKTVRLTQIAEHYNTSCLDETNTDSSIRQGLVEEFCIYIH